MPTDLPHVCETTITGTYNGERFYNVIHFLRIDATPMTTTDLAAIHNILDDASSDTDAWGHLYQRFDSGVLIDRIYSKTLSNSLPVELASAVSIAGASAGSDSQPLLSCMVKWTTTIADRPFRGRTYFCGVNTSFWNASDTDVFDSSFVTDFQTKVSAFVSAWDANTTYSFIILSRKLRDENLALPYSEIKGGSVTSRVAIQKRRSPGR